MATPPFHIAGAASDLCPNANQMLNSSIQKTSGKSIPNIPNLNPHPPLSPSLLHTHPLPTRIIALHSLFPSPHTTNPAGRASQSPDRSVLSRTRHHPASLSSSHLAVDPPLGKQPSCVIFLKHESGCSIPFSNAPSSPHC